MKFAAKLLAGTAIAMSFAAAPALADGMAKGKGGYHHASASECDASKFAGFYAGVHGGMGTLSSTFTPENIISIDKSEDGYAFGGQVGYNWVRCNAMIGIEADFSATDFDSNSGILGGLLGPFAPTISRSTDWLGSVRVRSGIAVGDMMMYLTGGIAFAGMDTSLDFLGLNIVKFDDTRVGWVAGVGTEYAISDRIRLTGSVMYYDFGTESAGLNPALGIPLPVNFDDHNSLWVSRVGVNFKLGHGDSYHAPMK